jgi:hypothetical protein
MNSFAVSHSWIWFSIRSASTADTWDTTASAAAVRQITMANRIGMTRRSFIVFPPYFPWSFGWFSGNFQPFQHICINLFFLRQAKKLERLKNNLSGKNPGCKSCIRGSLVIEL